MNDEKLSPLHSADFQWKESADGILFAASSGYIKPTAAEIVRIEYKGQTCLQGIDIKEKPSECLQKLKINRFPAKLSLELTMTSSSGEKPSLKIVLQGNSFKTTLPSLPGQDQIVIDRQWFPLYPDNIREISDLFETCGISDISTLSLRQCLDLIKSGADFLNLKVYNHNLTAPSSTTGTNFPELSDLLTKQKFSATLYPYQKIGVSWLYNLANEGLGCILADEMGLGKTLQIIALLTLFKNKWNRTALIVSPATLLENWRREFLKFSQGMAVLVHAGSHRTGFPSKLKKYDVIITSYETSVRDQGMLGTINWSFIVLDEAQAIKNPETQRANTLKSFNRMVSIAVSGTPIENRLRDLWSLMDFSCTGLLGNLEQFEFSNSHSEDYAKRIEKVVSPLLLRRRVADVAHDLPEKIIITQAVSMSDAELLQYEKLRQQISDEYGKSATLVSLIKLRQFCTHPFILGINGMAYPENYSNKYVRLIEIIEEIKELNQKAIIFTSFTGMLNLLVMDLHKRFAVPCNKIDGQIPVKDRQEILDAFSNVAGSAFLILNPRAAGVGLNITAANHVIHYNLEWNPAIEDQATARAYRRGQALPVTVHRLFYPGTIEEVIDDRIRRKRLLAETAVIGTEGVETDAADIARALSISPIAKGISAI